MQTVEEVLNDHEKALLEDYAAIMEFSVCELFTNKHIYAIYRDVDVKYGDVIKRELRRSLQRFEGMSVVTELPHRPVQIKLAENLMMLYNYGERKCDVLFDLYVDGKWAGRRFINRLHVIEDEET